MSHDTPRCSDPVGEGSDPCSKPAVCVYVHRGDELLTCWRHDSDRVRAKADESGYERRPLPEKAAA